MGFRGFQISLIIFPSEYIYLDQNLYIIILLVWSYIIPQRYSRVQKSIENFVFQRAGMREGGLPLPLAFQYLILMIWRACDLNLVMISSLASKCQHFKLRGLQFHFIKQVKNGHSNFKDLLFWSQWRYHNQI